MYYDMRMYSSLSGPQCYQKQQDVLSETCLRVLSAAVSKKFEQFWEERQKNEILRDLVRQMTAPKPHVEAPVVIDLCSEEQELEEKFNGQNQKKIQEIVVEDKSITPYFQGRDGARKLSIEAQISLELEEAVKFNSSKQNQNTISVITPEAFGNEMCHEDSDDDFAACCPEFKLVLPANEILRRKEGLLRRQVKSWDQIPKKGRKQRREVRMLYQ